MSIWENYLYSVTFDSLTKDIETDILIIGGGIFGFTTLYHLRKEASVCLVDAGRIGTGVSKNTTGKLTFLQGTIYSDLEKNLNYDVVKEYLSSQQYAINLAKEIVEKEKISCDFEEVTSFVHAIEEKDRSKLKKEKSFLEKNNIKVDEDFHSFLYTISVKDTYVFNPIKYINGLKQILQKKNIYENTMIQKIQYVDGMYYCFTPSNKIVAKKVIVACHYPFFLLPFFLPSKSYIEKSYFIACKVDKYELSSGITASNPGFSYRYYKDEKNVYKICLSSSHNTAVSQNDDKHFQNVKQMFQIKEEDVVASWSNVDIITSDQLPYIGEIQSNLYIGTGFNTWGMTNGFLASRIISDAVLGKENQYSSLFKVHRFNFYKVKRVFLSVGSTLLSFISSRLKTQEHVRFEKRNGIPVGIYVDGDGKEHVVVNRCPHAKCSLIFNEVEKTWDCPCHSSKFDIDGKWLKGPSVKDISYKKQRK